MLKKTVNAALLALVCCALGAAAQNSRQTLSIVLGSDSAAQAEAPLTFKKPSEAVRVEWVEQGAASPKTAGVYYSRTPNGGDISKYTEVRAVIKTDTSEFAGGIKKRYIRFIPENNNMAAGAYYCIVAYVEGNVTYYSNYFELKVASPDPPLLKAPKGLAGGVREISELTPSFSWEPVEGVPYYHVILSDEKLPFDSIMTGGALNLDLSIIWQAITPNTRVTYGAPDPSNTITAAPPPLSPGKEYSWLVFNNYGNHMAFSDGNTIDIPGTFRIKGEKLNEPKAVSPVGGKTESSDRVTFQWTNLDEKANSYLVNLFASTTPDQLGMGNLDSMNNTNINSASMLVWETTVSHGGRRQNQTLSADLLNARGTLAGGNYVWRVYALDSRGAATTGDSSKGSFNFEGTQPGYVTVKTVELVGGIESGVSYVELRSEVISGPMQAPLAFYTDAEGYIRNREFPEGNYRITAVKEGYNNQTATISVKRGDTPPVNIYMKRPDAVIYGRIAGPDSAWVNLANVTAVSEWGDTVAALTNGSGNFTLNCREADWTVTVEKAGYRIPRARTVTADTLRRESNHNFGTLYLERNPNTLSGVVRNSGGEPVIGAKVRVLREGVLVEELASTPQNGAYSFSLSSGTYTLTAEKPGFAMYSRSIDLTGSRNQDITIAENAALINGTVFGRSWKRGGGGGYDYAPIPRAKVTFVSVYPPSDRDTFTVTSDATFGKFSISVPGGKRFIATSEADGFVGGAGKIVPSMTADPWQTPPEPDTTKGGQTTPFNDTLQALAMINGKALFRNAGLADVDIIVYDTAKNEIAASAKSANDGSFEIRNIPDGNYIINAGKSGYYLSGGWEWEYKKGLNVTGGRPNHESYEITMDVGQKKITWNVTGYNGRGSVKVTSPLNKTIPFSGSAAVLDSVGAGDYVIEAAAEPDTLLQLSYRKITVAADVDEYTDNIGFPLRHTPKDTVSANNGEVPLLLPAPPPAANLPINRLELYYRSEGSAQYKTIGLPGGGSSIDIKVRSDSIRDGCELQYYFRVYLENGDIYGSAKQVFTSYVKPGAATISRVDIDPGVMSGDTLYLPSSYAASFTFRAFYSDLFIPFGGNENFGSVAWSVTGAGGTVSGGGRTATLTTGARKSGNLLLRAVLTPASGYKLKNGKSGDTVAIPIKVTGAALKSAAVVRNGGSGPMPNTERASFRVEALDADTNPVTVSPAWSVTPETAGKIGGDGTFEPKPDFFGVARVHAEAGGMRAEYVEAGGGGEDMRPGLRVNYIVRSKSASDTASTHRGLRVAFPTNSIRGGESVELRAAIDNPKNDVKKNSGVFRMTDSLAYNVEFSRVNVVDSAVSVIIDVPERLRQEAANNPKNFKVARWSDSLTKWLPLPSSEVVYGGAAVAARLSGDADDNAGAGMGKKAKTLKKSGSAKTDGEPAEASKLYASATYACVVQNSKLSVNFTVSPNPFSPYIRPVKEYYYGKNYDYPQRGAVPAGTCVRVNIEAQEPVRSLKVHIYNATGKRVWAIDKFNADVGEEHRIWWDGRTLPREEMWENETFLEKNNGKGRMCRNGRYFVTVIVTDMEGRQVRAMKPLVLMK